MGSVGQLEGGFDAFQRIVTARVCRIAEEKWPDGFSNVVLKQAHSGVKEFYDTAGSRTDLTAWPLTRETGLPGAAAT